MTTRIKAKKDLYNAGKCFIKGEIYIVSGNVNTEAGLMEKQTINDLDQPHVIGSWWRDFKIVK